jgi:hypothetical protein
MQYLTSISLALAFWLSGLYLAKQVLADAFEPVRGLSFRVSERNYDNVIRRISRSEPCPATRSSCSSDVLSSIPVRETVRESSKSVELPAVRFPPPPQLFEGLRPSSPALAVSISANVLVQPTGLVQPQTIPTASTDKESDSSCFGLEWLCRVFVAGAPRLGPEHTADRCYLAARW